MPVKESLLVEWNKATADLSWGVQKVFRDAFELVAEEKVTLVYGADYSGGSPCLVNSVASMLTTSGGHGIPSAHFGKVVGLFDQINYALYHEGVNTTYGRVSPLAAEVFLRYFAPEKPKPELIPEQGKTPVGDEAYVEPKDDAMAQDWLNALQVESAMECDFPTIADYNEVKHGQSTRR